MTTATEFQAKPLPLISGSPALPTPITPLGNNRIDSNRASLFGKDGFTFFDFLDIINPLQHIPVISTIYRSITADQIDPGSKIAGGTIFGGPLGAVLASIDVAIEKKTGQDISDHAIAFFTGNNGSDYNNRHDVFSTVKDKRVEVAAAPPNVPPIDAGIVPAIGVATNREPLKPTGTTQIQPDAAGMGAIPIAKHKSSTSWQRPSFISPTLPDLGLLGGINNSNTQPQTPISARDSIQKPKSHLDAVALPYKLTPQFSAKKSTTTPTIRNQNNSNQQHRLESLKLAVADTKNRWVIDAMLRGIGKYESAAKIGDVPPQSALSVIR